MTVYAYSRVGYHRSLDMLRRNGWKGHGPVPWEHEPNRGFLRLPRAARAKAARTIGENDEWERCSEFLRDSSPHGVRRALVVGRLMRHRAGPHAQTGVRTSRSRYGVDSTLAGEPRSERSRTFAAPSARNSVGSRGPRSASTSRW